MWRGVEFLATNVALKCQLHRQRYPDSFNFCSRLDCRSPQRDKSPRVKKKLQETERRRFVRFFSRVSKFDTKSPRIVWLMSTNVHCVHNGVFCQLAPHETDCVDAMRAKTHTHLSSIQRIKNEFVNESIVWLAHERWRTHALAMFAWPTHPIRKFSQCNRIVCEKPR